jgi:hypothetical protein
MSGGVELGTVSGADPSQVDVQINPAVDSSNHNAFMQPATMVPYAGAAHMQHQLEDDDEDDSDLPPVKVKDALTYSLAITIAHEVAGTFMFVYSIISVATTSNVNTTDVAFAIAAAAFVYSHVFNKAHFNTSVESATHIPCVLALYLARGEHAGHE